MKKLILSYSGNLENYKHLKIADILQGKEMKNYFNNIKLENGKILESKKDGRYYDDNNICFEEVIYWDEQEEVGKSIGYIKI